MATKPVVQRIPNGLLGWFGIKNGGVNPTDVSATLDPSIDMLEWYLLGDVETAQVTFSTNALGFNSGVQVPAGEWWYLHSASVLVTVPAAGNITVACGTSFQGAGGGSNAHRFGDFINSSNPTDTMLAVYNGGIFLPPGARVGMYLTRNTGLAGFPVLQYAWTALPI